MEYTPIVPSKITSKYPRLLLGIVIDVDITTKYARSITFDSSINASHRIDTSIDW